MDPGTKTYPMRKLTSTSYSAAAFNIAMLLLRIVFGALIMNHGYSKLVNFSTLQHKFMNFLGMGSTLSLALVVFAEFFCGLFIILGLFTRMAAIPLVIVMMVALFKAHSGDFFDTGEMAALFLGGFFVLLMVGPGRVSVDGMIGK